MGDDSTPGGMHRANIWQGQFLRENDRADARYGTAPVTALPPNGFGLYQMTGNIRVCCED